MTGTAFCRDINTASARRSQSALTGHLPRQLDDMHRAGLS
jgi:hypothetical protein